MARTRRPLIAGNWKMNGLRADALALAKSVADGVQQAGWRDREVLICPPATLILAVAEAVKASGLLVGGQDCHAKPSGAHTGEIAAEMLRDCGATHVIVGHSERRADCGETDAIVCAKAEAAWRGRRPPEMLPDCGATPVIVGPSERRADCGETDAIVCAKAEAAWRAGLLP